jgi:hypothetical protein
MLVANGQPDSPILFIANSHLGSGLSDKTLHRPAGTDHPNVIVVIEHRFLMIGTPYGNEFCIPVYIEELPVHDFFRDEASHSALRSGDNLPQVDKKSPSLKFQHSAAFSSRQPPQGHDQSFIE